MKQNCTHAKEDLVFHYYNEMDEDRSALVEARLKVCPACRNYYASLAELEMFVPRAPSLEPDDAVMSSIRAATTSRLREVDSGALSKTRRPAMRRVNLAIFQRLSIAATVLAVAFMSGLFAGGSDSIDGGSGSDILAAISDVQFDASTGLINVHYRTEGSNVVTGKLGDSDIQTMLELALTDESNPGARLRATKLLAQMDFDPVQPSTEFVSALEKILIDDQNVGIQLHAVKALQKVHGSRELPESLSLTLMELLDTSPNSALRIEILELLTQNEVARQELARIFERASTDENSAIRTRAQVALDEMNQSIPLDELN